MKKLRLPHPRVALKTAGKYCALFACMALMSFALPQREPLSFPLCFAALCRGFDPFLTVAGYLVCSAAALSWAATLSTLIQSAFLLLVFLLYRKFGRDMKLERLVYAAAAQVPFVLLFPHTGYSLLPFPPVLQKLVIAVLLLLLSAFFDGALDSLLRRVFRCRLTAGQLAELLLVWIVLGLGVCGSLGTVAFSCAALAVMLLAVVLLKGAAAVPLAVALSAPLCLFEGSALPVALFALYACFSLLLAGYGRIAAALSFFVTYLASCFLLGVFFEGTREVILGVLPCVPATALALALPESLLERAKKTLLFYRERSLPRIAVNRSRRAVGERLFEVSSLFREIEGAFSESVPEDSAPPTIGEKLRATLCRDCPGRRRCEEAGAAAGIDKLVAIGCAKGQVSLVDLPSDLGATCKNAAGLLFACNKLLVSYRATARELQAAREGRLLLAKQAHGVSEILKDIALEQSEEYSFSEGETALSRALATAGILSSEIFVYGEGSTLTVSMTLAPDVDGKKLCAVAGGALGVPLSLSEKLPLTSNRTCYILRRRPNFDAAFGVASRTKRGENACGDAYSVLKIDERRFLVALSDGMGSGENARSVSDRTLSLLESFYKAKMPSDTVLSTVNRLIAYSPDETFSCLDLAAVDLDSGDADVVKIGSPAGFILSEEELRVLEGDSLPIGMLDAVHPATLRAKMKANDFMLFMSDGVSSAYGSSAELCEYLSGLRPVNPQSLAEQILQTALSRTGGNAEDDMTVVAVKLMKSA